eukprot:12672159-Ditylum_brightwellii.AAC.1
MTISTRRTKKGGKPNQKDKETTQTPTARCGPDSKETNKKRNDGRGLATLLRQWEALPKLM